MKKIQENKINKKKILKNISKNKIFEKSQIF